MIRCTISPLLFMLVMEMILCSPENNTKKITIPCMWAFMDDVTQITELRSHLEQVVNHQQKLFKLAVMKIKPFKWRSLSIIKGSYKEVQFSANGNKILTIHKKSIKSLSHFYSLPLTDQHRWQDLFKQQKDGLNSFDEHNHFDKNKLWCIYFGLISKSSWPLQILEISLTQVESMEHLIS